MSSDLNPLGGHMTTTPPAEGNDEAPKYVCGQWHTNCNNRAWPPMHTQACADLNARPAPAAQAPDEAVEKAARAVREVIWPGKADLDDWSLRLSVRVARAALADTADAPRTDVSAERHVEARAEAIDAGAAALGYTHLPESYLKVVYAAVDAYRAALRTDSTTGGAS